MNKDNMFYVVYKVFNFPGEYKAGPYSEKEVEYQKWDINGYEGVYNVQIVPANEIKEKKD